MDTGLLNNQGALLLREDGGVRERDKSSQSSTRPSVDYSPTMMPFLPDDQIDWALHQIEVGRQAGLKTIFMSHHQVGRRSLKIPVWCFTPLPPCLSSSRAPRASASPTTPLGCGVSVEQRRRLPNFRWLLISECWISCACIRSITGAERRS